MILICVCGYSGSGNTTTAYDLKDYFEAQGKSVMIVNGDKSNVMYETYRWVTKAAIDICIVDGVLQNAFERKDLIESIDDGIDVVNSDALSVDVYYVAVHHDRSDRFILDHNKNKSFKDLRVSHATYQTPIMEEGFDMIYNVRGQDHINLTGFISLLNRKFDMNYEVPVVVFKTEPVAAKPVEEETENGPVCSTEG